MNERLYQRGLVKRIEEMFPGCIVMKNDPGEIQGIPDMLILYGNRWAMLEVKAAKNSPRRMNQFHYINMFNEMSFAAFINPDNEEEVLDALQSTFGPTREACLPKS